MTLGVGILSHERRASVLRIVAAVRELGAEPVTLVVADDGLADGTADACRADGVRVIAGERRGPAWNRNRALWHLLSSGCEAIVLIEDDLVPVRAGWDREWAHGAERWGVVSYAPGDRAHVKTREGGAGTAEDPVRSPEEHGRRTGRQPGGDRGGGLPRLALSRLRLGARGVGGPRAAGGVRRGAPRASAAAQDPDAVHRRRP